MASRMVSCQLTGSIGASVPFGRPNIVYRKPASSGYFIDRMPNTMKIVMKNANTANVITKSAQPYEIMDYWRSNDGIAIGAGSLTNAAWARYVLKVEEISAWSKSTQLPANADIQTPEWVKRALDPWNAGCEAIARYALAAAKNSGKFGKAICPFPDPPLSFSPGPINELASNATRNDIEWFREIMKWDVHWQPDGALDLTPSDPFALYVGRFGWQCIPMGYVEQLSPKPNATVAEIEIHINLVGVFAVDRYNFSNDGAVGVVWDQTLGEWNVDSGSEGIRGSVGAVASGLVRGQLKLTRDAGYYPPMGWTYVTNDAFNRYRTETTHGRDFVMLSDIRALPVQRTWISGDDGKTWKEKVN